MLSQSPKKLLPCTQISHKKRQYTPVCKAYQSFYRENTAIPTQSLRRILKLILQENFFEFNSKNSKHTELQWVQRWQLPLPTSFCRRSRQKYRTPAKLNLLSGKDRFTIFFSLWRTERKEIDEFIALANRHHPSIKFTAEISDKEINFLDTTVYKGERFHNQGILEICTHFKPTETFQYTHFSFCNPHRSEKVS